MIQARRFRPRSSNFLAFFVLCDFARTPSAPVQPGVYTQHCRVERSAQPRHRVNTNSGDAGRSLFRLLYVVDVSRSTVQHLTHVRPRGDNTADGFWRSRLAWALCARSDKCCGLLRALRTDHWLFVLRVFRARTSSFLLPEQVSAGTPYQPASGRALHVNGAHTRGDAEPTLHGWLPYARPFICR
jgi:hypothetical protein